MGARYIDIMVSMDSAPPSGVLNGGLQYEDNATDVVFTISPELHQTISDSGTPAYRIDFNSGAGYDPGASDNPFEGGSNQVIRSIPYKFTCLGGTMEATLVCTALNKDNTAAVTVLTYPVTIGFAPVKRNTVSVEKVENSLSALEAQIRADIESGAFQGEKGDKGDPGDRGEPGVAGKNGKDADYNLVCNALKGSASGNPIRIDDVSPLEHEIAVGLKSKNLFNIGAQLVGKWVLIGSGAIGDYSIFNTSDYIAIPPNTTFIGNFIRHCAFYDADKNYVGDSGNASTTAQKSFTMPANAHYMRFSYENAKTDGSNVQLEIGSTLSAYSPFVNVSGAKVQKYGKNLIPYPYYNTTKTTNGITFTDNGDGSVYVKGTATANCSFTFTYRNTESDFRLIEGQTYTLSGLPIVASYTTAYAYVRESAGKVHYLSSGTSLTFTATASGNKVEIVLNIVSGYAADFTIRPQLEASTMASAYTPYVAPTTYTADADGTVEGVTSLYPTTTLTADDGIVINAEYNRDINKVIADIIAKIGGI